MSICSKKDICPCLNLLRIRGGKQAKTMNECGLIREGISPFVEQLRSGQIIMLGNEQASETTKNENFSIPSDNRRNDSYIGRVNVSNSHTDSSHPHVVSVPESYQGGAASLYEQIGLRSSALEEKIGQKIVNETLSGMVPPSYSDEEETSGDEIDDPEKQPSFLQDIMPDDDMDTITHKYLAHLRELGNKLGAEAGIPNWMDTDEFNIADSPATEAGGEEEVGDTTTKDIEHGRDGEFEWVDLNSECPPEREKAFVKAACRQILYVRNLPKTITAVRSSLSRCDGAGTS